MEDCCECTYLSTSYNRELTNGGPAACFLDRCEGGGINSTLQNTSETPPRYRMLQKDWTDLGSGKFAFGILNAQSLFAYRPDGLL
jgi:hypothetical protein